MDTENPTEARQIIEEISLVDILSIIIKRRFVILACAVLGLALGLWFFFTDVSRSAPPIYTATLDAFFYDPVVKTPKAVIESFVRSERFRTALGTSSTMNNDSLSISYNDTKLLLTIEVKTYDKEQALSGPMQALNALKLSYAMVEARKSALALVLLNASAEGINELRSSISLESPPFELNALGDTRVSLSAPKSAWPQKAILSLFACLFMGLLLAFVAEGFDRMRADPEARKKLRDAWGRRA